MIHKRKNVMEESEVLATVPLNLYEFTFLITEKV